MGSMALGVYFRVLREQYHTATGKRLTQEQLVEMVRPYNRTIAQSVISKLETGEDIPGGDILAILLEILGGRLEDVVWIIRRNATVDEGRRRALDALAADIEKESDLEQLIADWRADESVRRSIRRTWRAWIFGRATAGEGQ